MGGTEVAVLDVFFNGHLGSQAINISPPKVSGVNATRLKKRRFCFPFAFFTLFRCYFVSSV
jgi:hypothetical protein